MYFTMQQQQQQPPSGKKTGPSQRDDQWQNDAIPFNTIKNCICSFFYVHGLFMHHFKHTCTQHIYRFFKVQANVLFFSFIFCFLSFFSYSADIVFIPKCLRCLFQLKNASDEIDNNTTKCISFINT